MQADPSILINAVVALVVCLAGCLHGSAGVPASSQPSDVLQRMITNEKRARTERSNFSYFSEERSTRTEDHLWREKNVETEDGVLRRLLAIDGQLVSPVQAEAENRRINDLVANPQVFIRINASQKDDEARLLQVLQLLPKAFLISPDGEQEGCTRFAFRPNPAFQPSTMEERIVHVMAGVVSVKQPEDRLCGLEAKIMEPVEFGFGIFGRINAGGHFSVERNEVDAGSWKTRHLIVHIDGRILMLKSLSKNLEMTRSSIIPIPEHVSLSQAAQMSRP